MLERGPFKLSLLADRSRIQALLGLLVRQGPIADISVEEEDIGVVVERIYAAGEGAGA